MNVSTFSQASTSTKGTVFNGSGRNISGQVQVSAGSTTSDDTSGDQLLWAPGAFMALAMVIFLAISFYRYHRRFRRKRKLAMEYVDMALDIKRPRIGAPAGFLINLHQLIESPTVRRDEYKVPNGDIRIIPCGKSQTFHNPTFENEGENDSKLSVVCADIHRPFEDQDPPKYALDAQAEPSDVELRLSQLCKHCAHRVLISTNQTRKPAKSHIDSDLGEYTLRTYDPGDDYATMDAFHGRSAPRERRRPTAEAPKRNRFGFTVFSTANKAPKRLCPFCFAPKKGVLV